MRSYTYRWCSLLLACMVLAMGVAGQAGAVTITLRASQDNTLYDNSAGSLSNGAGEFFFAGRNGGAGGQITLRGLIQFDVASQIPQGAIVNSVTLTLNVSTPMPHTGTVLLHQVLASWGEGTSDAGMGEAGGAPSTPGDATWIHTHFGSALWATPGGNFSPEASASSVVAMVNSPQVIMIVTTPGLEADVQGWVDNPDSNNGWLLRQENEAAAAIRFDSRDNANPTLHPILTIDYSLPPLLVSPQSGIFALTQVMDLVAFVNPPVGLTVMGATVLRNGVDVTASVGACLLGVQGTVISGGQTFRCPSLAAADLGEGMHTLDITFTFSDGSSAQQAVNWLIIGNTEP